MVARSRQSLHRARLERRKHLTERVFDVCKPRMWPPRCDTSVPPEEIRRFFLQRAAEFAQRCAVFDAVVATPAP